MKTNGKTRENQERELAPVGNGIEDLLARAIENKVDVATMERLLAMRRELKAEWAKTEYVKALAAFQAECPVIKKTKPVYERDKKTVRYKYAAIESIIEQVKGLLAKHGFSYTVDALHEERFLGAVCKVTHRAGHTEVSTFRVPVGTESFMSDVQKYGARNTFAKRYAFTNAFGILTGDEDTDAAEEAAADPVARKLNANPALYNSSYQGNGRITYRQACFIRDLLEKKGHTERQLCVKYEVAAITELSSETASQIIENLKRLPDFDTREEIDIDQVAADIERNGMRAL